MSADLPSTREPGASFWYRRLINLYPGVFRERYAAECFGYSRKTGAESAAKARAPVGGIGFTSYGICSEHCPASGLAAMPLLTKISLFGVGILVFRNAINGRWLTIAYWLFFCVFLVAGWALSLRRPRLSSVSSWLLIGALGLAGLYLEKLLAGFGLSSDKDAFGSIGSGLLSVMMGCDLVLNARFICPRRFSRAGFKSTCVITVVYFGGSLLFGHGEDGSHAFVIFSACQVILMRLLSIWQIPNQAHNPGSEARPA